MRRNTGHMVLFLIILNGLTWLLPSCERKKDFGGFEDEVTWTIEDFLKDNQESYSRFHSITTNGGLTNTLSSYNPAGEGYTLFLPSDEAFDRYIQSSSKYSSFDALLNDTEFTEELGRYHIVSDGMATNDFPYGALPDTTLSGESLTIGFSTNLDSTLYKVNNVSPVVIANIETVNGMIHVIDEVLEPVIYSSNEWLKENAGFTILSEVFTQSGLSDTMGIYRYSQEGSPIRNYYTIFAEHDSVFARNEIYSYDDLVGKIGTDGLEPDNPEGRMYQFGAYHIIEGSYFLDEFTQTRNYNTYANFPVSINTNELEIKINKGVDTFRLEIEGTDTTFINYIALYYQQSNVLSKNGAIHMLSEIMDLFKPVRSERRFQFYEEINIQENRNTDGEHEFIEHEEFDFIDWTGPEKIVYVKSSQDNERAWNRDYLEIEGRFTIEYTVPKILPGRYQVVLRANGNSFNNAMVQVFIDGVRKGANLDLTKGGESNDPYVMYTVGGVEFSQYTNHTIKIKSLIPGRLIWDAVQFLPE